jgi:uncharacterized protein YcfL
MKRILLLIFLAGLFSVVGCSSNNSNNNNADSADITMPDTAASGMGADTTSAATDSLRDSLNR